MGLARKKIASAVTCELVQGTELTWSLLTRWAIRKQIPHLRSLLRDGLSSLPWFLQRVSLRMRSSVSLEHQRAGRWGGGVLKLCVEDLMHAWRPPSWKPCKYQAGRLISHFLQPARAQTPWETPFQSCLALDLVCGPRDPQSPSCYIALD